LQILKLTGDGLSINFKTQRQYQDIIGQIEDLTKE